MALELVCNEDATIAFSNTAGPGDITYIGDVGPASTGVTSVISTKVKANSKGVCTTSFVFTWVMVPVPPDPPAPCPHSSASATFVSGAGSVIATATKTKAGGSVVMRDCDTGTCVGSWTDNASGNPVPCACNVSISSAGQTKVKAQ